MPKMKTHSGAKKRLKTTGSGKITHRRPNRNHFLAKKSTSTKRGYTKDFALSGGNAENVKKMLKRK